MSTHKSKNPSDEGICCARGGTRTVFQPLKTLGKSENMQNPEQSEVSKTRSRAESVDNVHTLTFGL